VFSFALPVSSLVLTKYEHWQYMETILEPLEAQNSKMTLIQGMLNGIKAVAPERLSDDVHGVDTLMMQIDAFYKDPANRNIPVVWLLIVADHKLSKQSFSEPPNTIIENELLELRKFYEPRKGIPLP
jgi:hypothetical protein